MCIANGFYSVMFQANVTWAPTYLVRYLGFSVSRAATMTGVIALVGIPAFVVGGFVIDRWYRRDVASRMWFASICGSLSAACLAAGFMRESLPFILLGFFMDSAAFPTAIAVSTQEIVPHWNRSTAYGLAAFVSYLFSLAGPTMVGYLSQRFGLENALIYLQGLTLIGPAGFLLATRTYRHDYLRAQGENVAEARSLSPDPSRPQASKAAR